MMVTLPLTLPIAPGSKATVIWQVEPLIGRTVPLQWSEVRMNGPVTLTVSRVTGMDFFFFFE